MSSRKANQSPRAKAHVLKVQSSVKKLKKKASSRALMDTLGDTLTTQEDDNVSFRGSSNLERTAQLEDKSVGQFMKVNLFYQNF
jgi:hypothetical protein